MKKIVALVLSLVMVLGLATTAFAAQKETTYEGLYGENAAGQDINYKIDLTITEGKAPTYDKKTGELTAAGELEHAYFTYNGGTYGPYVLVDSLKDLTETNDIVLYKDEDMKIPVFYLQKVAGVEYVEGAEFANFGEACGQVLYDADEDVKYYTVKGDFDVNVYEADEDGTMLLKVGSKFVTVNATEVADVTDVNEHKAVYTTKNGEIQSIECGVCGLDAVKVANVLSLPEKAVVVENTTTWYWPAAAAAPEADEKVESAETFDAGIAMYVGMSVMAAAGSAVVLKKKD